ncbi:MAG: 6-phospho-3-hexuloisomerase [Promethearchaeia archaeon]
MQEIGEQVLENKKIIDTDAVFDLIKMIQEIHKTGNRVFVYGAGRSGFIGRCFAQRLMHLGLKSCFVSDAVTHQYNESDLVIIISGSGETTTPVAIAQKARKIGGKIALLTGNPESTIGKIADCIIKVEGKSKNVATIQQTLAPYTSLFDVSTLSVLDSIGGTLMQLLGVTEEDIDKRHATIE